MLSGIYMIYNKIAKKGYIGSAFDFDDRKYNHLCTLRRGTHQPCLQNAWNKYGEDAFEWIVLETCDIEILYEREQHWISKYYDAGKLYNLEKIVHQPMAGRHHTQETRDQISQNLKSYYASLTDEERKEELLPWIEAGIEGVKRRWAEMTPEERAKRTKPGLDARVKANRTRYANMTQEERREATRIMRESNKGRPSQYKGAKMCKICRHYKCYCKSVEF